MSASSSSVDWNARYLEGDTPWEKGCAAPPLAEFLEKHAFNGRILVPGCGLGHDVRLLARHGAEPVGLDIADSALEAARSFPKTGRETYRVGSFFEIEHEMAGSFDGIFEHTFLCAIPPSLRPDYVRSAHRLLKEGGHLLAIFFVDIDQPEGPPFEISTPEIDQLFHDNFETLEKWTPATAYPEREGREEMRLMQAI